MYLPAPRLPPITTSEQCHNFQGLVDGLVLYICVVLENIHTPPQRGECVVTGRGSHDQRPMKLQRTGEVDS